jgi:DNA-binding NtrC family response regulator
MPNGDTEAAVVVVEDEHLVRWVMVESLTDAGLRVLEAKDADEALTLLSGRCDVRVLITDVNMPGQMDGVRLAQFAHRHWPKLGIIVLSGKEQPRPSELPPNARFFPKPVSMAALDSAARALLDRARSGGTASKPVMPRTTVLPNEEDSRGRQLPNEPED